MSGEVVRSWTRLLDAELFEDRSVGDEEPDPQARHQQLGERTDVDDLADVVECLDRRQGASFVAEVTDEVVLEDRDVVARREASAVGDVGRR